MRCFTRRSGQMLRIGDDVILTVTSVRGGSVRLGFKVPSDMIVDREEVAEQKKRERVAGNLRFTAQRRVLARTSAPGAGRKTHTAKVPAAKAPRVSKAGARRPKPPKRP